MDKEALALHILNLIFPPPSKILMNLYNEFLSFDAILNNGMWKQYKESNLDTSIANQVQIYNSEVRENGIDLIPITSPKYPTLLKEIPAPPLGLYIKGELEIPESCLAVIGTRKPTPYGLKIIEKIIKEISHTNLTIVSGLALGCDTQAHKTALKYKLKTIGVLGSGLNNIFPSSNKNLSEDIVINNGLLVSEFPPNTPPMKHHFPLRNRIISGLSLGVVVAEAPLKSGALITARDALNQNREVFAVPNQVGNKNSEGPHFLIKSGAKLTESGNDILEELMTQTSIIIESPIEKETTDLTKEEKIVLLALNNASDIDTLISTTKLETNTLLSIITILELKGVVKKIDDKYIKINC